ncbi:MAG: CBS domain-containing protein [Gemmatimonadaceae bacterium]|nr:CBS domain-containing protein [Gemmatimonadaceae bacterium]
MAMRLDEIMACRVITIASDEPASAAWTRMRRRGIRHLVVVDDGQLVGVVSERDLGGRTGAAKRRGRTVRSMMTRTVVGAAPETSVEEAANIMRRQLIGSLPVVDGDRLVGIVTATDVFDALQAERPARMSWAEEQLLRAPASSKRLGGLPVPRRRGERRTRKRSARPENVTKREPMAAQIPRAAKRVAGRTASPEVPVHIRAMGIEMADETRDYVRRTLGRKLGKFAMSIERVSVRLRDVNGPRGGIDHQCRIKVVLSGMPSVVAEGQHMSMKEAIDAATATAERSVRRRVQRRRMEPRKRGRGVRLVAAR